jgi:hypothetical protein
VKRILHLSSIVPLATIIAMCLTSGCSDKHEALEIATISVSGEKLSYKFRNIKPTSVELLEDATSVKVVRRISLYDEESVDLVELRDEKKFQIKANLDQDRILEFKFAPSNIEHGFFNGEGTSETGGYERVESIFISGSEERTLNWK